MKNLILIMLITTSLHSQVKLQSEDRFSVHVLTDNMVFQKGLFYGGIEFQAEFSNGIYIRPQVHYAALKDNYIETSAGIGMNLSLDRCDRLNVYSGVKIGTIHRANTYPLFGIETGIEYNVFKEISIGFRASYDKRGDSDFYEGKPWVYNSQAYLKFIL